MKIASVVLGLLLLQGGARSQLLPGDTLRYTLDGSEPGPSSPFVVAGSNSIFLDTTTTIRARLYRPGYAPSAVFSKTVWVASGFVSFAFQPRITPLDSLMLQDMNMLLRILLADLNSARLTLTSQHANLSEEHAKLRDLLLSLFPGAPVGRDTGR